MSKCTCDGSIFIDSMCTVCLKKAEKKLQERIEKLQDQIDYLESDLDIVQWHLENPICAGGCGENTAHCQCEKEESA